MRLRKDRSESVFVKNSVIVMAERDYEKLVRKRPTFKEFLIGPGASLDGLALTRDRSAMPEVKL